MANGNLGGHFKESAITPQDMLPAGVDQAQENDVAWLHTQLACWMNYWSLRYPDDTLEQAMLNLIVRLSKAKAGWIAERDDPFPFDWAIASAYAGQFERYIDGKV
jgi:hypothetical protein